MSNPCVGMPLFRYEDTLLVCQNNVGMNLIGLGNEDFDEAMDVDIAEGGALSHNNDIIDIYSNSWGPPDTGLLASGPKLLARMALEMGAKEVCDIPHRKSSSLE